MQEQEAIALHISSPGSFAPAEKGQILRRRAMAWYDDGQIWLGPTFLVGGVAGMAHR